MPQQTRFRIVRLEERIAPSACCGCKGGSKGGGSNHGGSHHGGSNHGGSHHGGSHRDGSH
jgi:hypothetical protein